MNKILLIAVGLIFCNALMVRASCPIEDDPTELARCIQIDVSAIVAVAKGSNDLNSFCALASRYLECIKTYSRGCIGGFAGEGIMTEIQNIAMYCCNGITSNIDCPLNPTVRHTCIDGESQVLLADGSSKAIGTLEIGDKVKTLDGNGKLTDTDVVMMMDLSDQESLFLSIKTYTDKEIRVSSSHLIATPDGSYKFAKELNREDSIMGYDFATQQQIEEKIKSILIVPVSSYAAPLTMSGTILVDGLLASNYAILKNHKLAHAVMAPARLWYSIHNEIPMAAQSGMSQIEKQLNGTHWYPQMWHAFTTQFLQSVVKFH